MQVRKARGPGREFWIAVTVPMSRFDPNVSSRHWDSESWISSGTRHHLAIEAVAAGLLAWHVDTRSGDFESSQRASS